MNDKQKKNLVLAGTVFLIFIVETIGRYLWKNYDSQADGGISFYINLIWSLNILCVWGFIGFITKHSKQGIQSGIAHFVLFLISLYFDIPTYILNSLIAFGLFGYLVKFSRVQCIQFSVIGTILYLGSLTLRNEFVFWNLLYEFFDFESDTINFLNNDVSNLGILLVSHLCFFILISIFYEKIKKGTGMNLLQINLASTSRTALSSYYFYLFYIAIVSYSYNIVSSLMTFSKFDSGNYLIFLINGLMIVVKLLFIYVLIWFYRKVLLEFLLSKERDISWNYYFLQFPIVRTFIWLYIAFTNKINKINTAKNYKISTTQNDGILAFMVVFFFLNLILRLSSEDFYFGLISGLISLVSLVLFVTNKYGVHILFAVQILFFFILVYIKYNKPIMIDLDWVNHWYFLLISLSYIQYPLFHLKEFEIIKPTEGL